MSNKQIDPRGPRFGAVITSVLLLVDVYLSLTPATFPLSVSLLGIIVALFAIGAFLGNARHPYSFLYKRFVRPLLKEPKELEDSRPPQFAQFVGFLVAGTGLVFGALNIELGLTIAAGAAFFAAFLNAAFNFCLGCQIWLGLARIGWVKA
jgi:hypothetical protein